MKDNTATVSSSWNDAFRSTETQLKTWISSIEQIKDGGDEKSAKEALASRIREELTTIRKVMDDCAELEREYRKLTDRPESVEIVPRAQT